MRIELLSSHMVQDLSASTGTGHESAQLHKMVCTAARPEPAATTANACRAASGCRARPNDRPDRADRRRQTPMPALRMRTLLSAWPGQRLAALPLPRMQAQLQRPERHAAGTATAARQMAGLP